MSEKKQNMAASVRARLLNLSRNEHIPFSEILQRYAIERLLYRLSQSAYSEKFVLKGAQMLVVWGGEYSRPTMDVDFLARVDNSLENIHSIFEGLCADNDIDSDGLLLDASSVRCQVIKEDADYEGVRVNFSGHLEKARVSLQVDIGFDDAVTPSAERQMYPSLLGMDEASLLCYNRETQIAEKYEAMVKLGELNSRMKDFFDVWYMARTFSFHRVTLARAIRKTFERRKTPLNDKLPELLRPGSDMATGKQGQWQGFLRKNNLEYPPKGFSGVTTVIEAFLNPVVRAAVRNETTDAVWKKGGPWV